MILTIILVVVVIIGILVAIKSYDYDILGGIIAFIFGLWLIIQLVSLLTVSYYYELFVVKRAAFEKTLNNARENGNEYETAAIVKEVAEWNTSLAEKKYDNKNWFLGQYEDDRVETLEPIK